MTHVVQAGNQIGDRGAEMIGEGLKVNSSLRQLHLVRVVLHGLCFDCCFSVDGMGAYVQSSFSNREARVFTAFVLKYRHRTSRGVAHSTFMVHHRSCAAAVI